MVVLAEGEGNIEVVFAAVADDAAIHVPVTRTGVAGGVGDLGPGSVGVNKVDKEMRLLWVSFYAANYMLFAVTRVAKYLVRPLEFWVCRCRCHL